MTSRTYSQLIRENRDFRRLWIAAVISMLGEWFNTIALFFLILEYTESEFLLGLLFTVRMAGFALLQPLIGLMADRFNRKMLMIVSNLMQAVLALVFLLVNDASDIVWMIGLSGLMMVLHGVYMTAERPHYRTWFRRKTWQQRTPLMQRPGQRPCVLAPCWAAWLSPSGAPTPPSSWIH